MHEIIEVEQNYVLIGTSEGAVERVPIMSVKYDYPKKGDKVKLFKDGDSFVVSLYNEAASNRTSQYIAKERSINKHIFVWLGTFVFGAIGVDRFMRGQVGLGIIKILTIGALGIWSLVDWIVAMVKAYGSAFGRDEEITFINGKYGR